ncbi:MAG: hypothetical protein HRU69_11880 [Flammeovirgaceae bacterium]|nr:MAG: hypothetical protein HRU69_11880 [Flammeovirgaceae bacterium]
MDILAELRKKAFKNQVNNLVCYIGNNPFRFRVLMDAFIQGPYRITQRAAWPLSYCSENYPELLKPYLGNLLKIVSHRDTAVALKRNIIRLLQFVDIPAKFQGSVLTICYTLLTSRTETRAVKVFAMTVLSNIALKQPSLARELVLILEDHLPYASPGYRSRALKIIARHKK